MTIFLAAKKSKHKSRHGGQMSDFERDCQDTDSVVFTKQRFRGLVYSLVLNIQSAISYAF